MGNNPVVSFDPDGGYCYDSNGNQIACPDDGDLYKDYVDNPDNHITILDEVVVTPSDQDTVETVETEEPEIVKGDKVLIDIDEEAMIAAILLTATTTSQLDGPEPGPADAVAAGQVLSGLALISALQQLEDFVNRNQTHVNNFSKTARGNQRDTGLQGVTDEEIAAELATLTGNKLTKEQKARKRRLQKEQKVRTQRNKQKKGSEKGTGTGRRQ